jgi:hypothetical protein
MNPLFRPFVAFNLKLQYSANKDNLLDITTHGIPPGDFASLYCSIELELLQYVNIHYTVVPKLLIQYARKTRRIAVRIKDI